MPQSVDKTANSTIMVVSSDPKFLKFLEMSLKLEFKYTILSLKNGKRAFDLSLHVKPDLFIIDYHLLDLSALELSTLLHNITELESVPIIVINAPVPYWSNHQPYNATFLTMQFALEDLYSAVNENLVLNR